MSDNTNTVQHAIFREVTQETQDRGGYTSRAERIGVKWSEVHEAWRQACKVDLEEHPHLDHKPLADCTYGEVLVTVMSVNHLTGRRFIVSFDHGMSWLLRD